jgi:hypothetical protein
LPRNILIVHLAASQIVILSFFAFVSRRKKVASLLLASLVVCSSLVFFSPEVRAGSQVSHSAIAINTDSGFNAANGVTGGTGTASDPYVISGWSIEYQSAPAQISVSNTRAHFIVRNVTAYGQSNGITLSNVTNGRLENLESDGGAGYGSGTGILVTGSNNIWITSVQVSSSGTPNTGGGGPGIIIQSSSNILITNNTIPSNVGSDLTVRSSTNVTITGNYIGSSATGYGMDLSGVNVSISQNGFHGSGLILSGSVKVASDNTVNGKPLYFYHDCNNLSINNVPVGQLIISNCSNVQLSNLSISNTDLGITMYGVHHALIQNVSSTSNYYNNIRIGGSTNVTIERSDFSNVPLNYFDGPGAWNAVNIYGSNNTIVNGNVITNGQRAIALSSDVNATVSGNTLAHGNGMLCLYGSTSIRIYHNNFLIDTDNPQFCFSGTQPGHFWDNGFPSGGDYWSNYTGSDPDNDGIGDTPQPIPGGVYQDRYPLMNPNPASIPLTIEFNWTPAYPMTGQAATFIGSAVGGVAPYSYNWDFGDGSTDSGRSLTHVYSQASFSMKASLTVTDSASPHASQTLLHYLIVHSSPPSSTVSITKTINFDGFSVTTSGNLSISSGTVTGTISSTAVNSPTGAILFSKAYAISSLKITGNSTRFLLNIGVSPDPLSADIMLTQAGGIWSATVMVTRQLDIAAHGTVDIVDIGIVTTAFGAYPGRPLYSSRTDVAARGSIDIVDVGMLFAFYGAPDYS